MSRRQGFAALPPSVVLIDGEHYPPVTARAIAALQAEGERPQRRVLAQEVAADDQRHFSPARFLVPLIEFNEASQRSCR